MGCYKWVEIEIICCYYTRITYLAQSSRAMDTDEPFTSIAPLLTGAVKNASARGSIDPPVKSESIDQRAIELNTSSDDATSSH